MRRGELGSIRWSKIDRKQRRIEFDADSTKEAYSKYVYYDKELDEVLEKLAVEREINSMTGTGANSDFVFFGKNGTPFQSIPLHPLSVTIAMLMQRKPEMINSVR